MVGYMHLPGSVITMPRPESAADRVTRVLAERIADGTYPRGSKLPTVRELRAELGVSDMPIRTAVDRLKSRHLLVHVPGVGTFVAD